ncbi:ribosome-binding factor A [Parelusimicrobium proximum]|uniref:30S ribosome-binding factor RbfA n=1 Tax=Parelusimicrobium proximum TaxID=3228953 RepID=UPI003D16BCFE
MIDRIKRLENLFLGEINTIVSKMISSGQIKGFVTIIGVKVSKDLRTARVYYSVLGGAEDKKNAADQLSILRSEIGHLLRHRLHLKRIPSFSFEYDDTPERASKVESIFSIIEKQNEEEK